MLNHIKQEIIRRREERIQFYRGSIGTRMKKKRIEKNMTQEDLGKGVMSNTFVSKIENNVIHPNKESLLMLMERLDLPLDTIDLPEQMLDLLDRAIEAFYWNNEEKYRQIMDECNSYDFAVLIQITRLGYHVFMNENKEATRIQNELYRYLTSMDNTAFAVFLIFGMVNLIQNQEYVNAEEYRKSVLAMLPSDPRIVALEKYYESVLYGRCGKYRLSAESQTLAKEMFMQKGNIARVIQIDIDRFEFAIAEKSDFRLEYEPESFPFLTRHDRNRLALLRAISGEDPLIQLQKIDKDSPLYPFSCFVHCLLSMKDLDMEEYQKAKVSLEQVRDHFKDGIDWYEIVQLHEKKDLWEYQLYLSEVAMPMAIKMRNLPLMMIFSNEISAVLSDKKRYRDAYLCQREFRANVERINKNLNFKKGPETM